jgi:hypothetical protein
VDDVLGPHKTKSNIVVLHPAHPHAAALGRLVSELIGAGAIVECDPPNLGQISPDERDALTAADLILLVDDVAITGTRIRQYRAYLNLLHIVAAADGPEVGGVVGVLRPSSTARREAILDLIDRPSRLLFAEEIMLPDWREPDCPWCHELRFIKRSRVASESLMDLRRARLQAGGLTSELFLPFSASVMPGAHEGFLGLLESPYDEPPEDPMDLGPRSVFGELEDESQVFVAIASALQRMRDRQVDDSLSDSFTSPISKVLSPEFFVSGRFYAPVILCSILRASRRFDIRATAIESRLRKAVGERYADLPAIRAELLYTMARGVLPRPSEVADRELLSGIDPSVGTFLTWFGKLTG